MSIDIYRSMNFDPTIPVHYRMADLLNRKGKKAEAAGHLALLLESNDGQSKNPEQIEFTKKFVVKLGRFHLQVRIQAIPCHT